MKSFNAVFSEQEIDDLLSALNFFLVNYTDAPQTKYSMKILSNKLWNIKKEEKIK